MASILTNNGAMVALQTMRNINKSMETTQGQIATGMKVATAKDNASTWAIASVMRSDVGGFKAIQSTLATANATVAVARGASESIVGLLQTVKDKVTEAQSASADRGKIQADILELRNQISSIVGTAQFNGVNLINGGGELKVLTSLDRDGSGNVSAGTLTVNSQDLRVGALTEVTGVAGSDRAVWGGAIMAENGGMQGLTIANVAKGDVLRIQIGTETRAFVAGEDDTNESMAARIAGAMSGGAITASVAAAVITFTNNAEAGDPADSNDLRVSAASFEADDDGLAGGLGGLAGFDVSEASGAANALAQVDALLNSAINAAAAFGTAQGRIDNQQEFMGKLIDSMNNGIGALVDADMEEASARLQALQVQQQLGIQALSIANQQPQNILALFR
ncbi:flagellin [Rhodobaculum claviforme]|uniref:Flagellin n=1 Tax=Rhodobaculum claviforme TaxID=1549854 RepID=A0A934WJ79_9RHOB|nr:flagellin [Rhodobaculum claviforme]MBK5927647.1 hypothetical protein [Rhodobaculum claviforme]